MLSTHFRLQGETLSAAASCADCGSGLMASSRRQWCSPKLLDDEPSLHSSSQAFSTVCGVCSKSRILGSGLAATLSPNAGLLLALPVVLVGTACNTRHMVLRATLGSFEPVNVLTGRV